MRSKWKLEPLQEHSGYPLGWLGPPPDSPFAPGAPPFPLRFWTADDVQAARLGGFGAPSEAGQAVPDAKPPPGLVNTQQVERPSQGSLEIDTRLARLARMKRSTLTTTRLSLADALRGGKRVKSAMLTLTYRDDVEWSPGHVSGLLRHLRQWAERRGEVIPYVWVAELTQRGRMHYHVLLSLPRGLTLPKPDKQGWWPHGHTRIEWARKPAGYLAKYASKGTIEDRYPKGARIYGSGGLGELVRLARSWLMLPRSIRELCQPEHRVVRAKGGGWLSRATGELFRSAWLCCAAAHGRVVVRPNPGVVNHPMLELPAMVPAEWIVFHV